MEGTVHDCYRQDFSQSRLLLQSRQVRDSAIYDSRNLSKTSFVPGMYPCFFYLHSFETEELFLLKGRNFLKRDSVIYTDILRRHSVSSCLFLLHPVPSSEMCFALVLRFFPCSHVSAEWWGLAHLYKVSCATKIRWLCHKNPTSLPSLNNCTWPMAPLCQRVKDWL